MDAALPDGALEELLAHLEPNDRSAEPRLLDVGFSSVVVRIGGTVARLARNDDAARGHQRESRILPALEGRLPVAIPSPCRLIPRSPSLPFGAALHPYLTGRVMTETDALARPALCGEIATTLAALHAVPPEVLPSGSVPDLDPLPELDRLLSAANAFLRARLTSSQRRELERIVETCRRTLPGRRRVVSHADPWFGNMLLDETGRLVALLDFQDACMADPAFDLAAQTYLEPPSAEATIHAYIDLVGPQPDLDARVRCYLLFRELGGLTYAVRNRLDAEIEHAFGDVIGLLGP